MVLELEKVESELLPELVEALEKLEKEGKHVLKATNKPTTIRDVVIMAEAKDADLEKNRKEKRK